MKILVRSCPYRRLCTEFGACPPNRRVVSRNSSPTNCRWVWLRFTKVFVLLLLILTVGGGSTFNFSYAKTPAKKSSQLPDAPAKKEEAQEPSKKATAVPQGQLPEVIIKGGEKTGVTSEKPLLEIEINPDKPIYPILEVEEELLKRQPESLHNPRAGFSESLSNTHTILPGRIRLAKDPVKVFYPLREIMTVSPSLSQEIGTGWEVVITDADGHSFRKFSGRGLPPSNIPWNGRSDRGEIVGVGKTYSTVIAFKDTRGQERNFVGEPFSFDGIIHQESKGLVISLSLSFVFEMKPDLTESETIGESGIELLEEAADWIKQYYFTSPIRVECYTADLVHALSHAQLISKTLASLLLLPRGEIPANGVSSDISSGRIDIIIVNR